MVRKRNDDEVCAIRIIANAVNNDNVVVGNKGWLVADGDDVCTGEATSTVRKLVMLVLGVICVVQQWW